MADSASDPKPGSAVAAGFGVLLAVLVLPLSVLCAAALTGLKGSDAAGNAMSQGFTALFLILLDFLLGVLLLLAALAGRAPSGIKTALIVLGVLWAAVVWGVLAMMSGPSTPIGEWPALIAAIGAPLLVAVALWCLLRPLRIRIPPRAAAAALAIVAVACAAFAPLTMLRDAALEREAERVAGWHDKLAAVPADAPLDQLTPFLSSAVYSVEQDARARMRSLPSRQSDTEAMLDRDEFPFVELGALDLDPTPSLCAKARASLARGAAKLATEAPSSAGYRAVSERVAGASAAIGWLVGMDCASDAESRAWEAAARAHGSGDFEVYDLVNAREPAALGAVLNNYPPKFSMLTPKASLKAWLSFATNQDTEDPETKAAIEGARKLDHRNADALALLEGSDPGLDGARLMKYLPQLDLDATPALCRAGLKWIDAQFAAAYRPPASDPRPYWDLVEALGIGRPLMAVQWFALNGCDADAQLAEAESLINAYGDAPQKGEILAALARLRHKP